MYKTIKILILIISTIILFGIIQIVFPPKVNGYSIDNNTEIWQSKTRYMTWGELKNTGKIEVWGTHIFRNKFIFCYQKGESLNNGSDGDNKTTYYLTYKYNIEDGKVQRVVRRDGTEKFGSWSSNTDYVTFANKLLYMASQIDEYGYRCTENDTKCPKKYHSEHSSSVANWMANCDPVQQAIWQYIDRQGDDIRNFYMIKDQKGYKLDDDAWTIFNYARDNITAETHYNGTIYVLISEEDDQQRLLLVEKAEKPSTPKVKLTFKKEDILEKGLAGATISIGRGSNVSAISKSSLTSTADGNMAEVEVTPASNTGTFTITLTETKSPNGYQGISGKVTLTVKYNKSTGAVESITSNNTNVTNSSSTVTIKNKPEANLTINKTDAVTGNKLENVNFKIQLENVETVKGYSVPTSGTVVITGLTTNANGQIKLTGIVPKNATKVITATITEVEAPNTNEYGYKPIDPITITMQYKNGAWTTTGGGAVSNNTVTLGIENQQVIDLSGMVWQDAQQGDKVVTGPNGIRDSYYKYVKVADGQGNYIVNYTNDGATFEYVGESKGNYRREEVSEAGLKGVLVELYNADGSGNKTGDRIAYTYTSDNGKYEFKGINRTQNGYKVEFKYDGINYIETELNAGNNDSIDSDAEEIGRKEFNEKFKTISKNQAMSIDGKTILLAYNQTDSTSTLKVNMDGTNPANNNQADFQIKSQTGTYITTTSNIDCGLIKKEFDLAIGTDVKSAKLEINERSAQYTYAQIMNGEMEDLKLDEILNQNSSNNESIKYNLYLYTSDYNYRIDDYKTGITNKVNPDDNNVSGYDNLKQLEAYVTYSVILKNQSKHNATVEQFVYYYDEAYIPYNITSTDKYDVTVDTQNRKITFTTKGDGFKLTAPDYRAEIDLTFKVASTENGLMLKEAKNVAEITKYSTEAGGLVDRDSAPDNANVEFIAGTPKANRYEDDTDEASGLNIAIKNDTRAITGKVFEDTDKDGKLNNENTAVNDVIVQLIEIKKIDEKDYEYIWQETRSGSNTVKTTARNGYPGEEYKNTVTETGRYEFKDFIPGNYIIRFIYGDGSTYDITSEEYKSSASNVREYNGQDYKSTMDKKYQEALYTESNYEAGASVARDNEARRLQVMAYSSTINSENGTALERRNKEDLENTWMCAETSKINVPVDANNTSMDDMNFGLSVRPNTKLVLEKHITGLKLTPTGTGVQPIVNAKANIENIINRETVEISGVIDGLAVIYSDRNNRGFWQVATDVEELMQGAELEVEYTYVIRNDGEKDYLSSNLVQNYIQNGGYDTYLKNKANEVKANTKGQTQNYGSFLGEFYYTGNIGTNDAEVQTRVDLLEEALNSDLTLKNSEGISFEKINTDVVEKNVFGIEGNSKNEKINTIVRNKEASKFLKPKSADWTKTITLTTTLASVSGGELGANLPSYIAEIVQYSNAAGRRDMESEPANLSYVHSDDTKMTLENTWLYEYEGKLCETQNETEIPTGATNIRKANEPDEFWAETIIITKPTGEDKLTPVQIVLITISSLTALGVGIVLIKKFVLKK